MIKSSYGNPNLSQNRTVEEVCLQESQEYTFVIYNGEPSADWHYTLSVYDEVILEGGNDTATGEIEFGLPLPASSLGASLVRYYFVLFLIWRSIS